VRPAISRVFALSLLVAPLSGLAGCTDFATPAELQKPTLLAVVADPPIARPGGQTRLELVVAGADGRMQAPATWTLIETLPGVAPMGTIAANPDGSATYQAPAQVPDRGPGVQPIDTVQIDIAAGERPLVAVKAIGVVDVAAANPALRAVTVAGADAMETVTIARGQHAPTTVEIDPAPGQGATWAWYTTLGHFDDDYQSQTATLIAPDDAGTGWLFVVARDGRGGVAWHGSRLTVE